MKIRPVLLTTWPVHIDFPLFRYNLIKYQDYFSGIWIGLSDHHQDTNYTNFIRQDLPFANFIEVQHKGSDWRNDAVNEVLDQIKTDEPILFTEQDFFPTKHLLEIVFSSGEDFVFHKEGHRIHPAFALINRELIEKTRKDFSAYPDSYGDHFAKFFYEISSIGTSLLGMGMTDKVDYWHMNGLTQNYMSVKNNQPLYQPNDFLLYNHLCISLPVENHPQFLQIEKAIEAKYGFPDVDSLLSSYFPK